MPRSRLVRLFSGIGPTDDVPDAYLHTTKALFELMEASPVWATWALAGDDIRVHIVYFMAAEEVRASSSRRSGELQVEFGRPAASLTDANGADSARGDARRVLAHLRSELSLGPLPELPSPDQVDIHIEQQRNEGRAWLAKAAGLAARLEDRLSPKSNGYICRAIKRGENIPGLMVARVVMEKVALTDDERALLHELVGDYGPDAQRLREAGLRPLARRPLPR